MSGEGERRRAFDFAFPGFSREAFSILARLKEEPHIEQYRKEKAGFEEHIKRPFSLFRDDLVVRAVLPFGWALETERNVFSRLLKNDFGAGGCHHHYWMAFYRPHRTRLSDIQLVHSLHPDRFTSGVYVGKQAGDAFEIAIGRLLDRPAEAVRIINDVLGVDGWQLTIEPAIASGEEGEKIDRMLARLPDGMKRVTGVWLRRSWFRASVEAAGVELVDRAVEAMQVAWPFYRFVTA